MTWVVDIKFTQSQSQRSMEKGSQLHAQPALPAKQQSKQGFDRRLLWPQNWSEGAGEEENIFPRRQPYFDSLIVQSVT
jgi:hypothetical protein